MDDAVGRDISGHAGITLNHGEVSYVDELMNGTASAKEDV